MRLLGLFQQAGPFLETHSSVFLRGQRIISPSMKQVVQLHRAERLARYEQVMALRMQGLSHQAIAERMGVGHSTVQSWIAARAFPERKRREQASQMLRTRQAEHLESWLEEVAKSPLTPLRAFVAGITQDQAGLSSPWSQGQTEGQITRLKLIKKQGYGRAGFDVLRQRVLHAA